MQLDKYRLELPHDTVFLVLGGNGYLGSKVVRRLVSQGYSVICTKRTSSKLNRLNDIKERVRWIPASIDAVEAVAAFQPFDYVLNLACNYGRSIPDDCIRRYDSVIEANTEFPLNIIDTSVALGSSHYLTIGTGLPDNLNIYSFSKKALSEFGRFYAEKDGIEFINVKLEMLYGADEPENRFIPSIIRKMIKGEKVATTIGTQHRDIIAVDDAVDAIFLILGSNLKGYHDISVGSGEAPTISELIDFIWEETGKRSRVNKGIIPMRSNEPDCIADNTFIKSLGKFEPVYWKDGIHDMIQKIYNNLNPLN